MPLAYRSILTTDMSEANAKLVRDVLSDWLTSKGLVPPTKNGTTTTGDKLISHFLVGKDAWTAERWTLQEYWPEPNWFTGVKDPSRRGITSVTTISEGEKLWLWVDVESPWLRYSPNGSEQLIEEPQEAGTPKLVRTLMAELELNDGQLPVVDSVLEIRREHLQSLKDHLMDASRSASVLVAALPIGTPKADWQLKLGELTRGLDGLAATVFIDSSLVGQFTQLMGFGHSVPAGGIRTYLPKVKPFDNADSYRHKLLSPSRIALDDNTYKLRRVIRRALVSRLGQAKLPDLLREADLELLRYARFLPFMDAGLGFNSQIVSDQAIDVEEAAQKLRDDREFWKQLASEYAADAENLSLRVTELLPWEGIANDLDNEVANQAREISKLESHIEFLRGKLSSQNRVSEAYEVFDTPEEASIPESFEELINRLNVFDNVRYFEGTPDEALALDEHAGIATAVTNCWNTLRTLNAYATMKKNGQFSGGLMNYTRDSKGGYLKMPEFKPSESETVNNNPKFRRQREMPVPREVEPSGIVMAEMHVDLQSVNNYPRMYFYDATGIDGFVYIGYIGEHLSNTRTN